MSDPPSVHPVDSCPKGSVMVIDGRLRDLLECQDMGFPVFASGQSTLGAAGYAKLKTVGEPVCMNAESKWPVLVKTGDIILADADGVVRIPIDVVSEVAQLAQKLKSADEFCMMDIQNGRSMVETFKEHRI